MKIERQELTLSTNQTAWLEYDQDGDLLEIIFRPAEATCAIELTESIILRFDWETNQPLSLGFISVSQLMQPTEYGPVYFQLLADEWPDEAREKVWSMLRAAPLADFLTLSTYAPAYIPKTIPMTTIRQPHFALRAA